MKNNQAEAENNVLSNFSEKLLKDTIEEFLAYTKAPHPSRHLGQALAYLQNWAENRHFKHYRDAYGNFWMDIPASPGHELQPKVILQSHMDMVCVSKEGKEIDFHQTPVKPCVNHNTITAEGTSLGADDGIGIAMALAIAKGTYPHGSLRILVTADEEIGLLGANNLDSFAIDADFLINLDSESIREIIISSAGSLGLRFCKTYHIQEVQGDKITLRVGDLKGGHSGTDIHKNRLSACFYFSEVFSSMTEHSIPYCLEEMHSGTADNAISTFGEAVFVVDESMTENVRQCIVSATEKLKSDYPEERISTDINILKSVCSQVISSVDSSNFIRMLRTIPQGVIRMSKTMENAVETSSNIGIINILEGKAEIVTHSRSFDSEQMDNIKQNLCNTADQLDFETESLFQSPAWYPDAHSKLLSLLLKSFEQSGGDIPEVKAVHAGLECGTFIGMHPNLNIVSIGPTIENIHSPSETLYTDTVKMLGKVLLYVLENIK